MCSIMSLRMVGVVIVGNALEVRCIGGIVEGRRAGEGGRRIRRGGGGGDKVQG